jgi:phosphatidylserine decarboxylase
VKEKLYQTCIELTNGKVTSKLVYKFGRSKYSRKFIPLFVKKYKINADEFKESIDQFGSLHDFFIRHLKDGTHSICNENDSVVSPADSVIEEIGKITEEAPIIVKGRTYHINEMIGCQEITQKYLGGTFIVFYLSPRDYHRFHAPYSGDIIHKNILGKKSFPVNKISMKYGKDPLSKNYRNVSELKHEDGHIAIIKVGAMNINTIERTHPSDHLEKGDEMGYFSFGSTVVLLFEKGTFEIDENIITPYPIRVGEKVGRIVAVEKNEENKNVENLFAEPVLS